MCVDATPEAISALRTDSARVSDSRRAVEGSSGTLAA
jgi:hypothetical protein